MQCMHFVNAPLITSSTCQPLLSLSPIQNAPSPGQLSSWCSRRGAAVLLRMFLQNAAGQAAKGKRRTRKNLHVADGRARAAVLVSDHDAAQALAGVQQLKAAVDVRELHGVRDVLVHAELAVHVVLDQLGHILARLEAAKRGAPPHTACTASCDQAKYGS